MTSGSMPAHRRAEASGADEERVDAGEMLDVDGGVAQGVGDERWSGLSGLAGAIVVVAERRRGRRIVIAQVLAKAGERLAGAEQHFGGCCMADLFATDRVLLVIERQGGPRDVADVQVITGWVGGKRDGETNDECHVGQAESLRPAVAGGCEVFGWA